jgi:hypothetical protein
MEANFECYCIGSRGLRQTPGCVLSLSIPRRITERDWKYGADAVGSIAFTPNLNHEQYLKPAQWDILRCFRGSGLATYFLNNSIEAFRSALVALLCSSSVVSIAWWLLQRLAVFMAGHQGTSKLPGTTDRKVACIS